MAISHKNTMDISLKQITWRNRDISDYYSNLPIYMLQDFAIKGGLENGCDINLAYPYIGNTKSIIDVGSAYGRVIKHLIRKGYAGKIYAIERSENFYDYLKNHYSNKAEIIKADILDFEPKQKVDAILWLWSGINDFHKSEHYSILRHMKNWLSPKGKIIIETLLHTLSPKNASIDSEKTFVIFSDYGTLYSYKTSADEIKEYGEQLNFKHIKHIYYNTNTQRKRILHFLSHSPILSQIS